MDETAFPSLKEEISAPPEEILYADQQGFLVAPGEDVEEVLARVKKTREGTEKFSRTVTKEGVVIDGIPIREQDRMTGEFLAPMLDTVEDCYGIRPEWMPAFFIQKGLGVFGGGGMFTGDDPETGGTVTFFVLRNAFRKSRTWLIYDRDEIMLHEYCHSARYGFTEPVFEEVLAYRSGKSRFRKYMGGAFRSVWRTRLLVISLVLFWLALLLQIFGGWPRTEFLLKLPMPVFFLCMAVDGIFRQTQANRACLNLSAVFGEDTEAVLLRLADDEIQRFSRKKFRNPSAIISEIRCCGKILRWQVIVHRFFQSPDQQHDSTEK